MPDLQDRDIARLEHASLSQDIEFLLARARAIGTGRANSRFSGIDLKARSYAVLALAVSGLNPTQKELSQFLSLDASQIVAITDELEAKGLVERVASNYDRRINIIVGTKEGEKVYAQAEDLARKSELESLGMLSEEEVNQLRVLLTKGCL